MLLSPRSDTRSTRGSPPLECGFPDADRECADRARIGERGGTRRVRHRGWLLGTTGTASPIGSPFIFQTA